MLSRAVTDSFVEDIGIMNPVSPYFSNLNPDVAVWVIVLGIVLLEFHYVKDFLVFVFMKLYEFFIQHNAEGL